MHMIAEIVIPPTTDVAGSIKQVMEYFCDEDEDDNIKRPTHCEWWDWYVIGGRWSGHKLRARIGEERLNAFTAELTKRKVTVSSITCGKEELKPASQIPMVDKLWRDWFPGMGEHCLLFHHSTDSYGRDGINPHDICKVSEIPPELTCERLIVALPHHYDEEKAAQGIILPRRMWAVDTWNKVEHQKTAFDGKVKAGLEAMTSAEKSNYNQVTVGPDWLCVTVDYHN